MREKLTLYINSYHTHKIVHIYIQQDNCAVHMQTYTDTDDYISTVCLDGIYPLVEAHKGMLETHLELLGNDFS